MMLLLGNNPLDTLCKEVCREFSYANSIIFFSRTHLSLFFFLPYFFACSLSLYFLSSFVKCKHCELCCSMEAQWKATHIDFAPFRSQMNAFAHASGGMNGGSGMLTLTMLLRIGLSHNHCFAHRRGIWLFWFVNLVVYWRMVFTLSNTQLF